jgi:hypothetical protein
MRKLLKKYIEKQRRKKENLHLCFISSQTTNADYGMGGERTLIHL